MSRSTIIHLVENGFTVECSEEKEDCWESKTFIYALVGDAISKALEFLTADADAPQTDDRPTPAAKEPLEASGPPPPATGSVSG